MRQVRGDCYVGIRVQGIDPEQGDALACGGGALLSDCAKRSGPLETEAALVLSYWFEGIARMPGTRYIPARLVRLTVDHAAQPTAIGDESGEIGEEV
jgi:hypothetical protein